MLLLGSGPWPGPAARRTGFPQHRLASAAHALRVGGHTLRVVCLVRGDELQAPVVDGPWAGRHAVVEEAPDTVARVEALAREAEVVVSMGPYGPGKVAARVVGERPWWADLPGDPFAELEAVIQAAARGEGALPDLEARVAAAQLAALAVLERADAIGVVSEVQRWAALGQLGLAGRLVDPSPIERVFVMPVAMDFGLQAAPRRRPPGELCVAVCGGLNTWFDEDSLMLAFDRALPRAPGLRLALTGGELPGHHSAAAGKVTAWAARHPGRVQVHGWLPQDQLAGALAGAHLGMCLDRPQREASLGSRTRLLFYAALGLEIATTPRSPIAAELIHDGLATALPEQDPAGIAEILVELTARGSTGAAETQRALAARYDPLAVARPLLDWLVSPTRAPPGRLPSADLGRQLQLAREELARVYQSPTWRALSRIQGWLRR